MLIWKGLQIYIYLQRKKTGAKCADTFVLACTSVRHLWKHTQLCDCPQEQEGDGRR